MKSMRGPVLIIGGLTIVILVLSVVQVTLVNSMATSGTELAGLQSKIKEYKLQNEILKEEYLMASSFTTIEEKAKRIGLVESKTQVNLSAPLPLAKR